MGIVIAVPIVLAANADVLALTPALQFGQWLGCWYWRGWGTACTGTRSPDCGPKAGGDG